MKFRKDKQEVQPTGEYRLGRDQIIFLGFVLLIKASEAKDQRSRIRSEQAHISILSQAGEQLVGNYPSNNPERNTTNVVLNETERETVGKALEFIVELDQMCEAGSKLSIRLGD